MTLIQIKASLDTHPYAQILKFSKTFDANIDNNVKFVLFVKISNLLVLKYQNYYLQ